MVVLVVAMYVARWFLADWTSYWLDELLSVNVYGQWHDTVGAALRELADRSVHPPLFQFILYYWIELFGDTEIATRSLSNLYVALTTLFLYLSLEKTFGRRIAFISIAAFSVMYAPIFVALETRSYAQTMFLVTASSYFILSLVRRLETGHDTPAVLLSAPTVGAAAANTALLLTHYYNFFVLAVQVGYLLLYSVWTRRRLPWLSRLGSPTIVFGVPLGLFSLIWGRVFLNEVRSGMSRYALEGPPSNFGSVLLENVIDLNFTPPRYVLGLFALVATLLLGRRLRSMMRERRWTEGTERGWILLYLVAWLVGPILVAYLVFLVTGAGRYNLRYFLFSVPPLAPLIVLTIEGSGRGITRLALGSKMARHAASLKMVALVGVITFWVLPAGLDAATHVKHDWRGIVRGLVDAIEADPEHSYIIFQASRRRRPLSNYYFERFSPNIRVYDTLQDTEEASGSYRIFTSQRDEIESYDYLVVVFPHLLPRHFPKAVEELENRYEVHHRQVNHVGRGYIVFDVEDGRSDTSPNSPRSLKNARFQRIDYNRNHPFRGRRWNWVMKTATAIKNSDSPQA